jgi:predicted RNA methylase
MLGRIKQRKLIEFLEEIEPFAQPKEELEQYQTNATIAGEMLHYISNQVEDFDYSSIVDLGCGTGILGIAACLCGAQYFKILMQAGHFAGHR